MPYFKLFWRNFNFLNKINSFYYKLPRPKKMSSLPWCRITNINHGGEVPYSLRALNPRRASGSNLGALAIMNFSTLVYSVEITYGINSVISKLMTFAENAETGQFLFLIMLILSYLTFS
jgi:hypothetical protein